MKAPAPPPREPFPKGTHTAVCYAVVDLGTQETTYMQEKKLVRQVKIQWEVPAIRIQYEKDGQEVDAPKVIGQTYTFSIGEKAKLNHLLTAWGFEDLPNLDFRELLGKNCLLNVIHKTSKTSGNVYSIVSTAMALPAGTPEIAPENPLMFYSIEDDGLEVPDGVYDWMKKIIGESVEHTSPVGIDRTNVEPEWNPENDEVVDDMPF